MDIAKRIIELREIKGYSTNKLATLSGLSQGFVRQIELGEKQPTIDSISKICAGLGISLGEFFLMNQLSYQKILNLWSIIWLILPRL